MNRNRFIQGLKSNIQLSEKERRRIIRRSLQKYPMENKMYGGDGGICRASTADQQTGSWLW